MVRQNKPKEYRLGKISALVHLDTQIQVMDGGIRWIQVSKISTSGRERAYKCEVKLILKDGHLAIYPDAKESIRQELISRFPEGSTAPQAILDLIEKATERHERVTEQMFGTVLANN